MDNVVVLPRGSIGKNFIPKEFLHHGEDEYYIRNFQVPWSKEFWRILSSSEIERLVRNNNTCDNWGGILVSDEFNPDLIRDTEFFGLVRIGAIRNVILQHHDLQIPVGITNSRIIDCDIGNDVAIHDVRYLAHYIIGDRCILTNIDEMHVSNHSKFGNGILKEGEEEEVRVWLEIMNETGSRKVLPFDGLIPADAYLWAKYRDDAALQRKLLEITQRRFDSRRGFYGTVGEQCVIKNSRIIKDARIGEHCYIKGANKLKNITLNSSPEEPIQIGEGVELVNGIVGYGCHIFYGCKAVRFILCNNSNLKYGARLINSILGENSTISCCEVLNNLIFPAHEQHHNNSFLIASVVMGQSNMAAGATVGSNHNSRANDNEIQAGRGFWPGLCTSVKHSSRFASFTLLSKADYPCELDIPFPFSLLNDDPAHDRLEVMPAFWWLHNMYALARNAGKFKGRDKRVHKIQNIEFESLAPDTVEEIFNGRALLELWVAKAAVRKAGGSPEAKTYEELLAMGRSLLSNPGKEADSLEVLGEKMEKSHRKVVILKPAEAYRAYGDMLLYYAVKNILDYIAAHPTDTFDSICVALKGERVRQWVNLGGQIVPASGIDALRHDIGTGILDSWDAIHTRYASLWAAYPLEKQKHAFAALCAILGKDMPSKQQWHEALDKALEVQRYICEQVYQSRKKDYDNYFRRNTYRNEEEMIAAIGRVDDNSFIKQVRTETEAFNKAIVEVKNKD